MRQLILCADMEGASGIFEHNRSWNWNGQEDWRKYGRACITSDALAICNAATDWTAPSLEIGMELFGFVRSKVKARICN